MTAGLMYAPAVRRLFAPLLAFTLLLAGAPAVAAQEPSIEPPPPAPAQPTDGADIVRLGKPLRGIVLARDASGVKRIAGAHIGTGEIAVQSDRAGRFYIPGATRTNHVSVVAPGYEVVRRVTTADYLVFFLEPIDIRAIYIPFGELSRQQVLDWVLGLARDGSITGVVIDVKDEGGSVLPSVANQTAYDIGAVWTPGTDVEGWLDQLGDLGIYRIARVVTFMDGWFAYNFRDAAILAADGSVFKDDIGFAWTNPFKESIQRHNIEIGVNAAAYFEEIQYDYVRFLTDPGISIRNAATPEERSATITQFAKDAAAALHAVGAAIAFDTFGQTTMILDDGGIGQVLEELGPHLDYYSPMVYPSTWSTGWFGLSYPASDPYTVIRASVSNAVHRLQPYPNIVVRPWLQDFHDYGAEKIFYGPDKVRIQIEAAVEAGGNGFMLWDPGLGYQVGVLSDLAREATDAGLFATRN